MQKASLLIFQSPLLPKKLSEVSYPNGKINQKTLTILCRSIKLDTRSNEALEHVD